MSPGRGTKTNKWASTKYISSNEYTWTSWHELAWLFVCGCAP